MIHFFGCFSVWRIESNWKQQQCSQKKKKNWNQKIKKKGYKRKKERKKNSQSRDTGLFWQTGATLHTRETLICPSLSLLFLPGVCWMTNSDCLIRLIFNSFFFFFFFFKILLIFIWALLSCWPRSFLSLFEEENKKAIPGLSSSHVSISRKKNIPRRSLSTVFSFPTLLIRWPNKNKQTKLKKKNFVFGPNDVAALTHGGGGGTYNGSVHRFHVSFSSPHLQG